MAILTSFTFISLNGFYKGPNEDIQWHNHGEEEVNYSVESLKSNNILLFGRVTYEMMKSFWPTQMAYNAYPEVAKGMNAAEKIVATRSLKSADWENTTIISENLVNQISSLKKNNEKNITILGSGNVLSQLANANLVDEFQIMLDPVLIGIGAPLMNDLKKSINLNLVKSQAFKSGSILLYYQPI